MDKISEFRNKLLDELRTNYNFPMIEDIKIEKIIDEDALSMGLNAYKYNIELILKEPFEILFDNDTVSNFEIVSVSEIDADHIIKVVSDFNNYLYNADIKNRYCYRELNRLTQSEFDAQYIKCANLFFKKDVRELTKQENSIVFRNVQRKPYNNSSEIVEDFQNFYKAYGRFPYKKERLYKVLEYAKKTNFITKEDLDKIYSLASSFAFDKLCEFIEKNKRWPYPNEKEYSRTWDEVCWNYRIGLYSKEQLIKIEVLYSRFNNSKESIGERLVNSYIAGLGYKFEKQKTFPDLVYKDKLRFDTCVTIDDKILLIEYDGIQHFEPIDYFGGEEGLRETQTRDRLKDEYCRTNNIPLLRISYNQSKDLENMIGNFISENIKKEHSK